MISTAFEYARPATLDEALGLVGTPGTKVIAGGQSLLPLLKLRLAHVDRLVDIGRLGELRGVREVDGGLAIGALTTYRDLADSALFATRHPRIVAALDGIADVQVRNRGTIGGAIAHCDPASDMPAILLAHDASLILRSRSGERTAPVRDFLTGAFTTSLGEDEIVTEIRLPDVPRGAGVAYERIEQKASGFSIVGVCAIVAHRYGVFGSATYDDVRVGVTGVGEVAYRARAVEDALNGSDCSPTALAAAAPLATEGVAVNADIHADRAYRTAMAAILTRRALDAARARSS